jgi:hypothetical protein
VNTLLLHFARPGGVIVIDPHIIFAQALSSQATRSSLISIFEILACAFLYFRIFDIMATTDTTDLEPWPARSF